MNEAISLAKKGFGYIVSITTRLVITPNIPSYRFEEGGLKFREGEALPFRNAGGSARSVRCGASVTRHIGVEVPKVRLLWHDARRGTETADGCAPTS